MRIWILLWSAFIITTKLATCKRSHLMNSALKKACDIVTQTLFEAKNSEEKAEILRNVEENWNIFSPTVVINKDFMRLVILAIKSMVTRDDYRLCTNINEETKDALLKIFNITEPFPIRNITKEPKSKSTKINKKKEFLFKEAVHEIDALVKRALKKSKTDDDKQKTIDFIKSRVEEVFKEKEKPKNNTKLYTGIISNETDMMVNQTFKSLIKTRNMNPEAAASTELMRKRDEVALGGIENLVYKALPLKPPKSISKFKPILENEIDNSIRKDVVNNNLSDIIITPGPFIGLTKEFDCKDVVAHTCSKLKDVSEFKCESDDVVIGIQQFCDGTVDCADGSDESDCVKHAVNKVHTATQIVSEIDVAKYCFENSVAKSMLPYQGDILTRLLKKQIAFIHKYTSNPRKMAIFENSPYSDIFEVVTEVIAIVKSFSLSLDVALCMDAEKEADKIIQEGEMLLDAEPTPAKSVHETLSECDCNNQLCLNPSCTANCKRICYQTYSLSRWTCKPAKGGAVGVALDDLCNGKTDCYDETDESNCFSQPFEAKHIYEEVLKQIKIFSMSKNFETARSRLISLHSAVRQLQSDSQGPNNNKLLYKIERDNIFSMLTDIYLDLVEEYNNMDRAEDAYQLLMSVNEKLVRALKRSNTGNVRIQTFDEICTCQGTKCTQLNCTKECVRLCFVRDLLTTYPCRNSSGNHSVHVDIMCNGRAQCPKREDEENCQNEICRNHHLVVLRHNLQVALDKFKYTSLEGGLEAWKEKASKRISSAENLDRLSPLAFKMLLQDILRDLAETYASNELIEESKMIRNERILKKYHELSLNIMELAKTSTK